MDGVEEEAIYVQPYQKKEKTEEVIKTEEVMFAVPVSIRAGKDRPFLRWDHDRAKKRNDDDDDGDKPVATRTRKNMIETQSEKNYRIVEIKDKSQHHYKPLPYPPPIQRPERTLPFPSSPSIQLLPYDDQSLRLDADVGNRVLQVCWFKLGVGGVVPKRMTSGAAGHDVYANDHYVIKPGSVVNVRTGIGLQIPHGYYAQIFGRSSLGLKGVVITGGVVDSDYRGEIGVTVLNMGKVDLVIESGDRIAQMVFLRCFSTEMIEIDFLDRQRTDRDVKKFGSTGRRDEDVEIKNI